jgi:hypothetical protein
MRISFATSQSNGFKKWSDAHPPASNDDDHPPEVTSLAVAVPRLHETEVIPERLQGPWFVPGVGASL